MTIYISPVRRYGTKTVVHITADDTDELIAADLSGWGVRDAGTVNEHITVTPAQAEIIAREFDAVQLEQDIFEE